VGTSIGRDEFVGIAGRATDGVLMHWLDRAIDAGIEGVGPFKGSRDLVETLRSKGLTTHQIVERLVRTQTGQAALQGAVTSAGGIASAAVGAPVGLAATLLVQARLVGAIACANGFDPGDGTVRQRIERCVTGTTEGEAAKRTTIATGRKATSYVYPKVQARAAQRVAARLASGKSGGAVASRLASTTATRAVPVIGALIGGAFDLVATRRVAERARREFSPGGGPYAGVIDAEVVSETVD
jgi:hypothetical protein